MPLIPPVAADRAANPRLTQQLQELLGFPARYLPDLPIKVRIRVQCAGLHREIELCSGPVEARRGALVFGGDELLALALGAEAERLFPADLKGYCLLKLHDAAFEVTDELTLGGVEPLADPGWSLARVLRALDLELRSIEIADDTPETQQKAA